MLKNTKALSSVAAFISGFGFERKLLIRFCGFQRLLVRIFCLLYENMGTFQFLQRNVCQRVAISLYKLANFGSHIDMHEFATDPYETL